jgi:hypothetical protein
MDEKKYCMHCGEEITPENDGIEINYGEIWQCAVCHEIEYGVKPWACVLYYASKGISTH